MPNSVIVISRAYCRPVTPELDNCGLKLNRSDNNKSM